MNNDRVYLSERFMNPVIDQARVFDSRQHGFAEGVPTPERTAPLFELSVYTESIGSVFICGEEHIIHAGDVRFLRPGDTIHSVPRCICKTVHFYLSGEQAAVPYNEFTDAFPRYFHCCRLAEYLPLFDEIISCHLSAAYGSDFEAKATLLRLLSAIYHEVTETSNVPIGEVEDDGVHSLDMKIVRAVNEYIGEYFASPVTLDVLGNNFGYNPQYLLRKYRELTGISPHTYLEQIRFSHAKFLLQNTSEPIAQICEECGFSSVSHFTTMFRRTVGKSPSAFRATANGFL